MKNIIYVALAFITFTSCQQKKIGFVDNGTLINDYQEKKDIEAEFQLKEEAFRKKADSIGQAFQVEAQKGQAEAQKLAQKNNRKKAEELMAGLQQKQQQLQQQMQGEQQALTQAFQVEIDSVISTVKTFVKGYGKTNKYTYILGTSDAAATVMYGEEASDLTNTILDALNADYKKEE
ncbi:MAG: OmpH family outer membrane protein [Algibacter sp.]